MTNKVRDYEVAHGDTLWRIAKENRCTVGEIRALNPKIGSGDHLSIGQSLSIPDRLMEFTVRFLNLLKKPPTGVRYKLSVGKKVLATDKVTDEKYEVTLHVSEDDVVKIEAQLIGQSEMALVANWTVTRDKPVLVVQVNSAKIPSKTEPHPKTPDKLPAPTSSPPKPGPAAPAPAAPAATPPKPSSPPVAPAPKPAGPPAPAKPAPAPPSKPAAKPATPPANVDQGQANKKGENAQGKPEHKLLPGDCACGKDLTLEQLLAAFPAQKKAIVEKFVEPMNKMMKSYNIDSCLRKSHALAQIGHESGQLRYTAEVLPKGVKEADVYDGYKGRGLIQLTFKTNYVKYGEFVGKDFLGDNRGNLEKVDAATDSAGWFWVHGYATDLNTYADDNDLIQISTSINGAFNGFDDRVAIFKRAHKALNAPKCKVEKNRSADYLSFEKSLAYNKRDVAFAWAVWSDPDSKKHGLTKDAAVSKAAYQRFLELNKANPIKKTRFGFKSTADMIKLATEKTK
ncbi:LysM peptidoglycan-binding domain-containing protein [Massilia antarctica]|uniref:LysM peptidoglycan-binding domain-containing protein n=1 Tax=Massilia antarctica TaxID=2765360 RepID=A0AA48WD45_9BURK|nr:LysM peptidoglycan-binding domain-containing protein [Massilia antarctica]QPI49239.1 LysM peptidoglycan-binding domain-containing protein [Massilia antarctica]